MKCIIYMAMTVNGYVATKNNETPWSEEEWKAYETAVRKTKCLIIGRKTYEIMRRENNFEKLGNPFIVVLSKNKIISENNCASAKTPEEALTLIKSKGYKDVLLGGGVLANTSFLQAGLVDEIILDIESQFFGEGLHLFSPHPAIYHAQLLSTQLISPNVVQLHYKMKK